MRMNIDSHWEIERILDRLVGQEILVEAAAFCPAGWTGQFPLGWIPVRDLVLADEFPAAGMPVYFEGKLEEYKREIGFVYVRLAAPPGFEDEPIRALVTMNDRLVGFMGGPATVRLTFPFYVVRPSPDSASDWNELDGPPSRFRYRR